MKRARTPEETTIQHEIEALTSVKEDYKQRMLAYLENPENVTQHISPGVALYIDTQCLRTPRCRLLDLIPVFQCVFEETPDDRMRIKYECGGYYTQRTEKEELPRLALAFLDLVHPSICVTLAKHSDHETKWKELGYTQRYEYDTFTPGDWAKEGNGYWHDAVFEHDYEEKAWTYYWQQHAKRDSMDKDEWEKVEAETLRLWKQQQ